MDPTQRFVVIPEQPVDCDMEKRILRRVCFVTRAIAQDGGVVLPLGLRTDVFEAGGEILARHGMSTEARPQNIGRPLTVNLTERFGEVSVQFADTELARDYAYLYGLNDQRIPFARGWSFSWNDIETTTWGLAEAKRELGPDYDPDLLPDVVVKKRSVWVVKRGLLKEVSATPRRSDLKALTRAWHEHNIREAASLAHAIQMDEATSTIAELKRERQLDQARIAVLERDVAALRGAASPPAALGDGGDLVAELAALRDEIRNTRGK
jgi:hypothetical protein